MGIVEKILIGVIVVTVATLFTLSWFVFRADSRACAKYFADVPRAECVLGTKYQVVPQ